MTESDIESAVAEWLNAVRGSRVLVKGAIGESPAPSVPYVRYQLAGVQLPDFVALETGPTEQSARAADTRLTFLIDVVGDVGADTARRAAGRLALTLRHTQRTADLFAVAGLWSVGEIRNLTAVELGTMRQRMQFQLTLSAILTAETAEESMHTVQTGIHELTIPHTITITTTEP